MPEIAYYLNDIGTTKFLWCSLKERSMLISFIEVEKEPEVFFVSHFEGNILMGLAKRKQVYRKATATEAGIILSAAIRKVSTFLNKNAPHPFGQEANKQVT
jgi:hypothetical protein